MKLGKFGIASLALAATFGVAASAPSIALTLQAGQGKKKPAAPAKPIAPKPFEVSGEHIYLNGLALIGKAGDFKSARAGQWIKLTGFDNPVNNGTFKVASVAADGSAIDLAPASKTVYEPVATGKTRTVASTTEPPKNQPPKTTPKTNTPVEDPQKQAPEKVVTYEVKGDHLWINGLAVMGKAGDFSTARSGQWVKLEGFDNPVNNGVFKIAFVAADGSALDLAPGSTTVFEAAVKDKARTAASSTEPAPGSVTATATDPKQGAEVQKQAEEQLAPFNVTGDHISINGLAVMGKPGDFMNARAGQWVKLAGFDTPANNGIFLIESVDATGAAMNLDARSGTVFEAAVKDKVRTVQRSEPPGGPPDEKKADPPVQQKVDPPVQQKKVDPPVQQKVDPPVQQKVDPPVQQKTDPPKTNPTTDGKTNQTVDGKTNPPAQGNPDQVKVTNVAVESDLRAFLKEIASQTGVSIVPDESIVEASISIEFTNEPIESALEKIALMIGAYWKKKGPGFYLMSKATPKSSLFREFAVTRMYVPKNQTAATIGSVLSTVFKEYVAIDPKVNMIGITAPGPLMERILADVKMADSPSKQIVVEALVAEMTYEDGTDYGFSWSWKNFSVGSDLAMTYAKASFADIAKLKSLVDNRKATLLANPRLTAFEGRDSFFTVGQETYYSLLTGSTGFAYQQIQLIKTGITLKFTAFVDEDGTITLTLDPEVSDAIVAVNGNPTTNVRRASTSVRVRPGETIVIAGLSQHSTDRRVTRVPILGNLPIIGELFKTSKTSKRKTDVIIMITPQVTDNGVPATGDLKDLAGNVKKTGGGG